MTTAPASSSCPNPMQTDYKRYPKSLRGTPAMVSKWVKQAEEGRWALHHEERFWRDLHPFLVERGYTLRPRLTPGWKPSWTGTDINPVFCEDHWMSVLPWVVDARKADGSVVAIKWIPDAEHTVHELEIMRFLSSDDLRKDPRNRAVPLLDTFSHPTLPHGVFIVTPWLGSLIHFPVKFVNELMDFMLQTFDAIAFLHEHGVAHRDCTGPNIMVDFKTLYPPGVTWHPQRPGYNHDTTKFVEPRWRWRGKAQYYLIDYGISSRFEGPGPHLVTGVLGRDQGPPELSDNTPYDPFKIDVFTIGNYFLERYVSKYSNLEFLRPLLVDMTLGNPDERPSIHDALTTLRGLARRRFGPSFRWRLRRIDDTRNERILKDIVCAFRQLHMLARVFVVGTRELRFGRPS
ncbi:hypothetical protein EXIGLDRAFT_640546 [Exidia glandulosa HHB12029]|uniref:Protein kinase domain-containing protein n=1 Tax=Exidia glandulosa HHB12029 TaxID=1314781 RepID=A0A165MJP1_EXIGL|nr:hypothetical protein EXIGLDRAFT_640546 [Exidia glandulosa HHB12029]